MIMISSGGTYKTLETLFTHLDIPNMTHSTFDTISKHIGEKVQQITIQMLNENIEEEKKLISQNGEI